MWYAGGVALLLLVAIALGMRLWRSSPGLALPDKPSIAVLPFKNLSGDPDQEYFSDGMTEELITSLSKFSGLFIIARESAFRYRRSQADERQIGRELGVRYLVEGSVRRDGDRVRVSARLVDTENSRQFWADSYDERMIGLFALQDDGRAPDHGDARFARHYRRTQPIVAHTAGIHGCLRLLPARACGNAPLDRTRSPNAACKHHESAGSATPIA
jgi:TolB-like protein